MTYPKSHSKMPDVPIGTLNSIRRQLGLGHPEFDRFVACPMTAEEYARILRTRLAEEDAASHGRETGHDVEALANSWKCKACGARFPSTA